MLSLRIIPSFTFDFAKTVFNILFEFMKRVRERFIDNRVTFFPRFNLFDEFTSHYHRASWYLPYQHEKCEQIFLFHKFDKNIRPGKRQEYMSTSIGKSSHIILKTNIISFACSLLRSRVVLVWKNYHPSLKIMFALFGIKLEFVGTNDLSSVEYGIYPSLYWKHFLNQNEKELILSENKKRFLKIGNEISDMNYACSCVFGTGPSIDEAFDFDFTGCLSIISNSIVQNARLLDHIAPLFICAGDAVSHFGISRYAEIFRRDLIHTLKSRNIYFVTTARFGYLFLLNHPDIKNRTILIEQKIDGPNFNLLHNFNLPMLDSVLNILMFPIAATFTETTFLLGCDGKSTEKTKNEDFWVHSKKAQYHNLVNTGHKCHPTFNVHRKQKKTYARYKKAIDDTITLGEKFYSKKYFTLRPSNIPILKDRLIPDKWLKKIKLN